MLCEPLLDGGFGDVGMFSRDRGSWGMLVLVHGLCAPQSAAGKLDPMNNLDEKESRRRNALTSCMSRPERQRGEGAAMDLRCDEKERMHEGKLRCRVSRG
jgi:hypothetical protein